MAEWLAGGTAPAGRTVLRVNGTGTPWHDADLALAARHRIPVMLPKSEDPARLAAVVAATDGRCPLIPLVETAAGIVAAAGLCAAPDVVRAAFGSVDLATQLGVAHDDTLALQHARSQLVIASAAAGIAPPLDGVTTALNDAQALADDVQHARRLGFGGKLCIHPRQIAAVHTGFLPTPDELAWARSVLSTEGSRSTVDGHMVDKPVLDRARALLAAAGRDTDGRRDEGAAGSPPAGL